MANKRNLKKEINYILGELLTECLFNKYYMKDVNTERTDILIARIIEKQDELVCRVGTPDGKSNPKLVKIYYKKLIADFDSFIGEAMDEIEVLNKL